MSSLMSLKTEHFKDEENLTSFVNRFVSRENIQTIVGNSTDGYTLFYWERFKF